MAQNQVKRTVVLDGKVGSGFEGLISRVQSLSDAVSQVGKKASEFLQDGLDTYKDFETNMLAAEFALSSQYDSANDLSKVMETLNKSAHEWAQSTIFHTDDVSNAINEAAHAGWDLEKILTGIPQAMLIAQAGGLDLSAGLDYLIKMINSTGSSFDDAGTIVDQWAMAANSSATTIDELGQAFKSMGSTATLADSTAEIFTLLAALANVGTVGSQAGTALRSAMVRLIAPTTKADAAMSILGADAEEIESALAEESVTKAAKKLEGMGFSAYKADGELKPLTEVFSELYDVTSGLDEASRNEILAAIFPTRTIATALALLEAAKNNYNGLYDSIKNSEGYAQSGAEIMMSGLMGSTETLKSKWEEFQLKVGEFAAPEIETFQETLGNIVTWMNNWPSEIWNGFVGGVEALAAAGGIAGAAKTLVSLYGMLGPLGTVALLASFATGAMVGYFNELDRINWEEKFGQMDLDIEALNTYLDGVHTKWDEEKEILDVWDQAIQETLKNYETASTQLSAMLMTDVLTGKQLTDSDKKAIIGYYSDLYTAALTGIKDARSRSLQELGFNMQIAGAEGGEAENFLTQLILGNYATLEEQANDVGTRLGKTLADAMTDGIITLDEQKAINELVRQMNEIEAKVAATMREQNFYKELYRSQSVSWESASDYIKSVAGSRDKNLASIDEEYESILGSYRQMFEEAYKNGTVFKGYDGKEYRITDQNYAEMLAMMEAPIRAAWDAAKADENAKFAPVIAGVVDQLLTGSESGRGWDFLRQHLAGADEIQDINWAELEAQGKFTPEIAAQLGNLLSQDNSKLISLMKLAGDDSTVQGWINAMEGWKYASTFFDNYFNNKQSYIDSGGLEDPNNIWSTEEDREARRLRNSKAGELEAAQAHLAELRAQRDQYQGYIDKAQRQLQGEDRGFLQLGYKGDAATRASLEGYQATQAGIDVDITAAEAEIAKLEEEIAALDGLQPNVQLFPDYSPIENSTPPTLEGTVLYSPKFSRYYAAYAEGGRATQASIFGEAGAEWAIPEEHSDRTAELLDAARAASGFSWDELIARNGGLNGDSGGSVVIGNYSPTIHAADSTGVAQALKEDKERLKRIVREALRESRMMDRARAYA